MLAKCYSGAVNGVDARTVEIEVYSQLGTSQFAIVGLPDTAVKEAKDRIPKALKSQGLAPSKEYDVTVNLAPADVKKEGSIYDLPIAVGLLGATGRIKNRHLDEYGFIGGASAVLGDMVLFFGDPLSHPCGADIVRFTEAHGGRIETTGAHELRDLGSCVMI